MSLGGIKGVVLGTLALIRVVTFSSTTPTGAVPKYEPLG